MLSFLYVFSGLAQLHFFSSALNNFTAIKYGESIYTAATGQFHVSNCASKNKSDRKPF